jgi:hypothetical protein
MTRQEHIAQVNATLDRWERFPLDTGGYTGMERQEAFRDYEEACRGLATHDKRMQQQAWRRRRNRLEKITSRREILK